MSTEDKKTFIDVLDDEREKLNELIPTIDPDDDPKDPDQEPAGDE